MTGAEMDQAEHYGIVAMTPDGKVPGRMMAGPLIQLALGRQAAAMAGKRWGIMRAAAGEFVLPDTFGDFMVSHATVSDLLPHRRPKRWSGVG